MIYRICIWVFVLLDASTLSYKAATCIPQSLLAEQIVNETQRESMD
jgi:hypothetical protein